MKDRAGNELSVNDQVLFVRNGRSSGHLTWGKVVKITPQKVVIEFKERHLSYPSTTTVFPSGVVRPLLPV